MRGDVVGRRLPEHQAFEQRVGRQPVGAVEPRLGHFARGIEPGRIGTAVDIHQHPAAGIMLRGDDGDRLRRDVDAQPDELVVDVGEMLTDELGRLVADVEVDEIEPVALDLIVDRARDDVARGKLGALVVIGHEAVAGARVLEDPALAAHRLGDQEILDLEIVEAGRVELHELHVRHAAARAPRHRDPVPRRPARRGRIKIGAPCSAGGEDGRARGQCFDLAAEAVEGIGAVNRAAGRKVRGVTPGDQVDRDAVGQDGDVGVGERRFLQRFLDRPAGGVGDMDDAAVAMTALARQVAAPSPSILNGTPSSASRAIAAGAPLDDMLDHRAIVEAGAGDHRVADVILETVACLQHRGDPALRPLGRPATKLALGEDRDRLRRGEIERGGQPGRARCR